MNIQSINQTKSSDISFRKLTVRPGSFEALKNSKYFPDETYPRYHEHLLDFYKNLYQLKKRADKNLVYNVVIKPGDTRKKARIAIENSEGKEQSGFITPFDELLRIKSMEPKPLYTKQEDPRLIRRLFRNWQIKKNNNKLLNDQLNFKKFLNIVYKRIEKIVSNAECLTDLHKLKQSK